MGENILGGKSSAGARGFRRIFRSGIVTIAAGAMLFLTVAGSASTASAADTGESLFKANCAVCHGEDGHPTATGKALNAKDLTSAEAQKLTDAQITTQIENGKNNMPPFKSTLNASQVKLLVAYVRTLGKKK
jgi:mono/diheme cytochrome c family protein